jgi:hypothetical protein
VIRIVTRLAVRPKNRGKVMQNASRLIQFFERHGVKSEGVFENFHESEVIHLWSVADMAAYDEATAAIRNDAEFRAFAGEAAELIETERKEYWRALG